MEDEFDTDTWVEIDHCDAITTFKNVSNADIKQSILNKQHMNPKDMTTTNNNIYDICPLHNISIRVDKHSSCAIDARTGCTHTVWYEDEIPSSDLLTDHKSFITARSLLGT